MLIYPHIDPVALHLGPFAIRWYALAYLGGVLSGWWLVGKLNRRFTPPPLDAKAFDDIMVYAIFGIILGGRLGYILFYKPAYYFSHLTEIFKVWEGGMSFHGGLIGMISAMALFGYRYKVNLFAITDLLAVAAPIGLCLGMVFPTGGPLPRYPSQLFEAGLEGVVLFCIMLVAAFFTRALYKRGALSGLFLIGYCAARSICELFREPDDFLGYFPGGITMGQILSAPMLILGLYLLLRRRHEQARA
jgi:phosphatidylglycerol:prolipoprotein diacylglycerol transferase